jgi:hypothetical protein
MEDPVKISASIIMVEYVRLVLMHKSTTGSQHTFCKHSTKYYKTFFQRHSKTSVATKLPFRRALMVLATSAQHFPPQNVIDRQSRVDQLEHKA